MGRYQICLDLGVDEWFKWSNRVQKGNKCLKHTHFSSKSVFFAHRLRTKHLTITLDFFIKSDPRNGACTDIRIMVHALLRRGTVKRGNRVGAIHEDALFSGRESSPAEEENNKNNNNNNNNNDPSTSMYKCPASTRESSNQLDIQHGVEEQPQQQQV